MTADECERYWNYVKKDIHEAKMARLGKKQLSRIRMRLRQEWFQNIMMRKLIGTLTEEVSAEYLSAVKRSVVDYVLLDAGERKRINVHRVPKRFAIRVIRAPVPWHQSFITAKQFCR